jgi:hypothetical protein
MPLGSFHSETGLLLRQRGKLILQRDAGGTWRLDADPEAAALLGCRVRIDGIRSEFDVLEVSRVVASE